MTDLPATVELPAVPTLTVPAVRAARRRHGRRGRWGAVIVLAVVDWALAMLLLLSAAFPSPVPGDRGSATRSSVPSPALAPPAGDEESVAADASPIGRQGGGRDGGTPHAGVATTSTTEISGSVVSDAAPARGSDPGEGPVGGPASTVPPVPSTLPPAGPETTPPTAPPDPTPLATEPVPDTTPSTIPEETIP